MYIDLSDTASVAALFRAVKTLPPFQKAWEKAKAFASEKHHAFGFLVPQW